MRRRRAPSGKLARSGGQRCAHTISHGALGAAFAGTARQHQCRAATTQKDLDVFADDIFLDGACGTRRSRSMPRRNWSSPVLLDRGAPLAVADRSARRLLQHRRQRVDRHDLLAPPCDWRAGRRSGRLFLQAGSNQLAAGFFIYGPQFALVLTLGSGTHVFVPSARLGAFVPGAWSRLPCRRAPQEFAINAANYRHWDEAVRLYVDDCLKGGDGPRERDFNMRWIASLVADCYRILIRGGVYSSTPATAASGYAPGPAAAWSTRRNPIAFLIEQAGGSCHRHGQPHPRHRAPAAAPAQRALVFGSRARGRSASPATTPTPSSHRRARAAVRQPRPVPRLSARPMSARASASSRSPAHPARAPRR